MSSRRRLAILLRRWTWLAIVLASVALMSTADARPGGGGSYSGGSSGGSSSYSSSGSSSSGGSYSSSGGSGDMSPGMLVAMFVLLLIMWGVGAMIDGQGTVQFDSAAMIERDLGRTRLSAIRQRDETFSEVVFGDFLYGLVSRAYSANNAELAALAPYLSQKARNHLALRGQGPVQVVIGSISDTKVELPDNASLHGDNYYVEIEVNLNLISGGTTLYLKESWSLFRKADVTSRAPESAQIYNCPNCAAVFQSVDDITCGHCQEAVSLGQKDWFLNSVRMLSKQTHSGGVGNYSVEVGTRWHTNFDMHVSQWLANLRSETGFVDTTFVARCSMIFHRMNTAWSEDKLEDIRGLVSDGIYSYFDHGLAPYRDAGLKNVIRDAKVDGYEIAKVTRDAYYDAVVIRLWAHGIDYVVRQADNKYHSGNIINPRKYSEYWTMIRGRGVDKKIGVEAVCPNCGAELAISMSGNCEYCEAHVSSGEFDWVLGKIEQDEAYLG